MLDLFSRLTLEEPPAAAAGPARLAELPLLCLDAQTSGGSPPRARLIELAWCSGSDPETLGGGPVRFEERLPPAIARLTGLCEEQLRAAPTASQRWRELRLDAAELGNPAPTLIHFARFEEPYLRALHQAATPGEPFPLELLCTHAIATRLLPELPRRGIRALTGYLGLPVPDQRRACDHVRGTLAIWSALLPRLHARGIDDLRELRRWLRTAPPPRPRASFSFPLPRAQRLAAPAEPGVYRLLGARAELLYVGKAACLHQRVNSHFRGRRGRAERELELLMRAHDLEVTPTASALEAALLEVDLIQRLAPPFNRALRDRGELPCFVDPDLRSLSTRPDPTHCLGPVLGRRPLELLLLLRALLDGDAGPLPAWRSALGLPPGSPGDHPLRDSLAQFAARHRSSRGRRLLGLGRRLWRAGALADDEDGPLFASPPRRGAERLTEALELALARAAQLLRRGTWLVELSEASLCWERSGTARLLQIEAGRVVCSRALHPGEAAPAGRSLPRLERAAALDASACERLRVLSTELRRLCKEERNLRLQLGPGRLLEGPRLARRLGWV